MSEAVKEKKRTGAKPKPVKELDSEIEQLREAATKFSAELGELDEQHSALFDEEDTDDSISLLISGKLSRESQGKLREIEDRRNELHILQHRLAKRMLKAQIERAVLLHSETDKQYKEKVREVQVLQEQEFEIGQKVIASRNLVNELKYRRQSLEEQRRNFEEQLRRVEQHGVSNLSRG